MLYLALLYFICYNGIRRLGDIERGEKMVYGNFKTKKEIENELDRKTKYLQYAVTDYDNVHFALVKKEFDEVERLINIEGKELNTQAQTKFRKRIDALKPKFKMLYVNWDD